MSNPDNNDRCCSGRGKAMILAVMAILCSLAALVYFRRPQAQPDAVAIRAMVWTCIKHPEIRQRDPGRCPMCGRVLWPEDEGSQPAAGVKHASAYAEKTEPSPQADANAR